MPPEETRTDFWGRTIDYRLPADNIPIPRGDEQCDYSRYDQPRSNLLNPRTTQTFSRPAGVVVSPVRGLHSDAGRPQQRDIRVSAHFTNCFLFGLRAVR